MSSTTRSASTKKRKSTELSTRPASSSIQPSQRLLKRTWLRYAGHIAPAEGSDAPSLSLALQALDGVTDDVWACSALAEALQSSSLTLQDHVALSDRILTRTASAADAFARRYGQGDASDPGWETEARLLELRSIAVHAQRALLLAPVADGSSSSNVLSAKNEDEDDPWDDDEVSRDTALETPSSDAQPFNMPYYLERSFLQVAIDLVQDNKPQQLLDLLRSLPRVELQTIITERYELLSLLFLAAALHQGSVKSLYSLGLLPNVRGEEEQSIWLDSYQASTVLEDVVDTKNESLRPDEPRSLSRTELVEWYEEQVLLLEAQANKASSAQDLLDVALAAVGTAADQLLQLKEELAMLAALNSRSAPSTDAREFNLCDLRAAFEDPERSRQTALAYLASATSPSEADAAMHDLVVFLTRASGASGIATALKDLVFDVLRAQSNAPGRFGMDCLRLIASILRALSAADGAMILDEETRARLALVSIYGSERTDGSAKAAFSAIVDAAAPDDFSSKIAGVPAGARESLAILLAPRLPETMTTEELYNSLPTPSLELLPLVKSHVRASKTFAARGLRLSIASLAAASGDAAAQRRLVVRLLRAGDVKKESRVWAPLRLELEAMAGQGGLLEALGPRQATVVVLEEVLRNGDVSTFKILLADTSATATPSSEEAEELVLRVSRELYDNTESTNIHRGDMKIAYEALSAVTPTPRISAERAFIEGTSKLCSYNLSRSRDAQLEHARHEQVTPLQIRMSPNRQELIGRLLSLNDGAYQTVDIIIELARKLNAVGTPSRSSWGGASDLTQTSPKPKALIDAQTLAWISNAAVAAEDFRAARAACTRLVEQVAALRKRANAAAAAHADSTESSSMSLRDPNSAAAVLPQAQEEAWQACLQVARHPDFEDTSAKLELMAHVIELCPPDKVSGFLRQFRNAEDMHLAFLEANPTLPGGKDASRRLDQGFGAAAVASRMTSLSASDVRARASYAAGSIFSAAQAAQAASGGFSGLFNSARLAGVVDGLRGGAAPAPSAVGRTVPGAASLASPPASGGGGFGSRAAQLFDGLGDAPSARSSSPSGTSINLSGYMDPAERAARAARSFFGGFASGLPSGGAPGPRPETNGDVERDEKNSVRNVSASQGFSISRGAAWLLGEEERN
ncbi:hypothetical protein IE81DRAFT_225838 [Ceraceosorus guamensis]|uniref:Sec39 domain-containing protein n=1 Tax=Ceraceosorus guamensis TaxID=1522189 RepID=A0A316W7B2_9BASI|nr:hypothetical protein IE81DRAFT_225838 [Ceraceosorus guamensis]PWN45018.1 hypothetical protein IE81DRAFT_225838 [Ceraceosorus guamensis]